MAVMLSFGDAAPLLPKIKKAGALAICQVQHLAQARTVLKEGVDIIVAQGTEAGGPRNPRGRGGDCADSLDPPVTREGQPIIGSNCVQR